MINTLRSQFAKLQGIDPDSDAYRKLCTILDGASDNTLRAVYVANIKFVSSLALNRLIRRGVAVK